jgi:large subunit ribosomal protein L21
MYMLVEIKGKQYRAEKGSLLKVDKIDREKGEPVEFDSVLMIADENKTRFGKPYIEGARVKAVVEDHGRAKKIIVFKFKKRKNYRRRQGHRQSFTLLRVQDITAAD